MGEARELKEQFFVREGEREGTSDAKVAEENGKEKAKTRRRVKVGRLNAQEAARTNAAELGRRVRALLCPGRLKRKFVAFVRGYGILTITNANAKSVSREETRPEKGNEKDEEEDDMVERKEEKEKEKEKGAEIFVFGGGNLESLMMVKEAGKPVSYYRTIAGQKTGRSGSEGEEGISTTSEILYEGSTVLQVAEAPVPPEPEKFASCTRCRVN